MPAKKLRRARREYGVEDEAGNALIDPSATTKGAVRVAAARLAEGRGESVYVFEVGEDSDGTHIVVDREEIRPPVERPKSRAQIKREIDEVLARPARRDSSDRAAELVASYKPWASAYSYEVEDRTSSLANQLTDIDRQEGRAAPPVGYSTERFQQARQVVKDAHLYGEHQQRLRSKRG